MVGFGKVSSAPQVAQVVDIGREQALVDEWA
jgi:hypothetical protein